MISAIKKKMEAEMQRQGIAAEITFCRNDMFSVLVEDAGQFAKAKSLFSSLGNASFDSEEIDAEIGHIAFYRF